jgi:hypothetical protein
VHVKGAEALLTFEQKKHTEVKQALNLVSIYFALHQNAEIQMQSDAKIKHFAAPQKSKKGRKTRLLGQCSLRCCSAQLKMPYL